MDLTFNNIILYNPSAELKTDQVKSMAYITVIIL